MTIQGIKSRLKKCPLFYKVYHQAKEAIKEVNCDIPEVTPVCARVSLKDKGKLRVNLVVPSVDQQHVFGGIATAIRFFEELQKNCKCDARIITVDAPVDPKTAVIGQRYQVISSTEDSDHPFQVVAFCDRYQKTIPVRKSDLFIATGWWTAYTFRDVLKWQKDYYQEAMKPLIYLIQDYEPGFYPWSSRYLMADSTYQMDIPVYAVFNSKELRDFFDKGGYHFNKTYHFDPVLNASLKKFVPSENRVIIKKKQILIYGRPGTARNAFEVVVEALKSWNNLQPDANEWNIISAGEKHPPIQIGNGKMLTSVGKLTLEQYAQMMNETYAGISLMVSPHPSYPPLEMSTFGIKTITNCYGNKDLSYFNENIISIKNASPESIAKQLVKICSGFTGNGIQYVENAYVTSNQPFGTSVTDISTELMKF